MPTRKETLAGFRAAVDQNAAPSPDAARVAPLAPRRVTPTPLRPQIPPDDALDPDKPARTRMYHSDSLQHATGEPAPDTIGPRKRLQEFRASAAPDTTDGPITVVTEGVESAPAVDEYLAAGRPPRPAPVSDRWRQDAPVNASSFFRYFDEVFVAEEGADAASARPGAHSSNSSRSTSALRVKLPYWIALFAATMAVSFEAMRLLQPVFDPASVKAEKNDPAAKLARVEPDLSALDGDRPAIRWRIATLPGTTLSVDGRPIELDADGRGVFTTDISESCSGPALAEVKMEKAIQYVARRADGPPQEGTASVLVSIVPLELKQAKPQGGAGADVVLKGRTTPDARLTIQGVPVALAGGSFEKKLSPGDDVSEVVVRASRAGRAPRIVRVPIEHPKRDDAPP